MPKKLDFKNLRLCLDNYKAIFLYIRPIGYIHPSYRFGEKLGTKMLDFKKDKTGLYLIVDLGTGSDKIFHFPLKRYPKGFSLAYERFENIDNYKRIINLNHKINPYDPNRPYPERSILRHDLDDHLIEIFFKGMVNLKFHSWQDKTHWEYWTIKK